MSLIFYAVWRYEFLFLLIGSVLVNFLFATLISRFQGRGRMQQRILVFGVCCNLLLLAYYKYLFPVLSGLGRLEILHHQFAGVLLPLGISFFTFTQIAYLVDLQQQVAELQSFPEYVLFVTFFPHLIAGPILHHAEVMPQFKRMKLRLVSEDFSVGFTWFIFGLFKKVILADSIAPAADLAFSHPASLAFVPAWLGVVSYALQLYFDFSGYSDMAIGLARMFSIQFPLNFDSPYKAVNIVDFWSRWHMTLTRYVTAYLYSPISLRINRARLDRGQKISRKGSATFSGFAEMVALPTMVAMLLIGVWHGAGLQFLIFGFLHGLYITSYHAWRIFGKGRGHVTSSKLGALARHVCCVGLTIFCVLIAQVFFRASSTSDAYAMLAGMSGLHHFQMQAPSALLPSIVRIVLRLAVVWLLPNTQQIMGLFHDVDPTTYNVNRQRAWWPLWRPNLTWAAAATIAFVMSLVWMENTTRFLYFQF